MIPKELYANLRRLEIRTAKLANAELAGAWRSSFRGTGLSFREVRQYQPGDDVRTIDWNVSARMNEPYVKVFVEEREMTVMLAVDLSSSAAFGSRRVTKARAAAEVTALVAMSAVRSGDRVGLVVARREVERIVPPRRGDGHAMRIVREILEREEAGAEPPIPGKGLGATSNLRALLESLVGVARKRSVVFLVSDFLDVGFEQPLRLAASKHDVVAVVLDDPRDRELPDVGLALLEDLETGEPVAVDTSSPAVRDAWARWGQARADERKRAFGRLGLDVVTVDTRSSPAGPLRQLFARRARRMHR